MSKSFSRFTIRGMAVALLLALTVVPYISSMAATTTASLSGVVINEVLPDPNSVALSFDTDGNGTAADTDEFIELYNTSGSPVDISDWQLWDFSSPSWFVFPAGTVLGPGNFAVVVVGVQDGGTLPDVGAGNFAFDDGQGSSLISNGGDNIVLYAPNLDQYIQLIFNGDTPDDPVNDTVNYVGFSSTATRVGPIEDFGSDLDGTSMVREPAGDTNVVIHNTVSDFNASPGTATPPPGFDPGIGSCGEAATAISTIQGTGTASAVVGEKHTIEAVVVSDLVPGGFDGYYVQEEDADADVDASTSEGLFIYDPGTLLDVNVQDHVRVRGIVSEANGQTQITVDDVLLCAPNVALPTPATLNLPFASTTAPEAYEGMQVQFTQTLYVTETFAMGEFGEITLSSGSRLYNPTERVLPGSPDYVAYKAANDLNRILVDDASDVRYPDPVPYLSTFTPETLRIGDVTTSVSAVMGQGFGSYRLQPTAPIEFAPLNDRSLVTLPSAPEMRVASFNVLNYFTTLGSRGADNATEFARQEDKIVDALMTIDADVYGLMEIENNDDAAVAALVNALNAELGASVYAYVPTGITGDNGGGVAADEITVAIIYKPASVTPIGTTAVIETGTFDGLSRPPVAQAFVTPEGLQFIVVVNHFKSKGCSDAAGLDLDQGDGQSCYNATRVQSAIELTNWLATDPTGTGINDTLIIGDLNAYSQEDPIKQLEQTFTNLVSLFVPIEERYTYVFFGESGVLDHALAGGDLASLVEDVTLYHINADEPRALDYNDNVQDFPNEDLNNDLSLYTPDQWRSSDHDAVVVDLRLPGADGIIMVDSQVAAGSAFAVTVEDADLNESDILAELAQVTVTSDAGESEVLVLTETDVNTGVFTATVNLTTSDPTASNDIVEAQPGNVLTFTYTDALNSNGDENTLVTTQTLVGELELALVSPADNAYFRSGAEVTAFTWTPAAGVNAYNLIVFQTSTNVVRIGEVINTSVDPAACTESLCTYALSAGEQDMMTNGTYSWTVIANTEFGDVEANNAPFTFRIETGVLELVVNGGFEGGGTNKEPEGWRAKGVNNDRRKCNNDTKTFTPYGECVYMFRSSPTENSRLIQPLPVQTMRDGDTLTFSMQVDARNVVDNIRVGRMVVVYSDGTRAKINLRVPSAAVSGFELLSDSIALDLSTKDVTRVRVLVGWRGKQGKLFVDEVSVIVDPAATLGSGDTGGSGDIGTEGDVPLPEAPDGSQMRRSN